MQSFEKIKKEFNNLSLDTDVKMMLGIDLHFVVYNGK